MSTLPLTNGGTVQVDECDVPELSKYKWFGSGCGHRKYAATYINKRSTRMHRLIMKTPDGLVVDHINGDTLDNRRCNLRNCTTAQNVQNSVRRKPGLKGAYYRPKVNPKNPWITQIRIRGKCYYLGCYPTAELAHARYAEDHRIFFGGVLQRQDRRRCAF